MGPNLPVSIWNFMHLVGICVRRKTQVPHVVPCGPVPLYHAIPGSTEFLSATPGILVMGRVMCGHSTLF
jgi:hypothetical protein